MIRIAVTPADRDTARQLLTEYLLLPDAAPPENPNGLIFMARAV